MHPATTIGDDRSAMLLGRSTWLLYAGLPWRKRRTHQTLQGAAARKGPTAARSSWFASSPSRAFNLSMCNAFPTYQKRRFSNGWQHSHSATAWW